ncbi:MAG: hypothetical protein QOD26_861 [Betaproteobacteria bacterium]|nr:hypothetical protein [Betaproteobacteria bacterium]
MARAPSGVLAVSFILDADLERLRIPARRPARFADGLWRHTCFEVFLARKGSRAYREYNLSPSGEWASYAFRKYRLRQDASAKSPRPRLRRIGRTLRLDGTIEAKGPLRIGLSAVIEEKSGALSYWALRHPPGKPDFHHRRAFALELK